MADHDHSYKYLFSHARMVEDLLKGFVKEDWVNGLDFSSLEKVNGTYVSDDLREREDDIIWRVRWDSDHNRQAKENNVIAGTKRVGIAHQKSCRPPMHSICSYVLPAERQFL